MSQWAKRIGIPLLTLIVGWNLGVIYMQRVGPMYPVSGGGAATASGEVLTDPKNQADITLLWRVWNLLLQHYRDPSQLRAEPMIYGAVGGMVDGVGDPYTVFMTPKENTDFRESLAGTLQGIGAELKLENGAVMVVNPLKGSPAERAGLLPDDIVTEVNKASLDGKTLTEVVALIRGPKGTSVTLTVERKGKTNPLQLTIKREEIHIPSVESKVIDADGKQIGYVALNQFGDGSVEELKKALLEVKKKPLKGLILDLRGNGGGYLDGAVQIVSFFVAEGNVVTVDQRGSAPVERPVDGHPLLPIVPLVVLQNRGSASASEIVAGALQDSKSATIIGTKSFGKGTVQEVMDLPDGSSLRVTVARWLTPNGKDLGKEGIHPDFEVDLTADDFAAKRDPQLDAAVAFLATGKKPAKPAGSSASAGR